MNNVSSSGNICIIVLAAGASTRLGFPKQLVPFKDKTLLQYAIDVAISSNIGEIVVVLGAHSDEIKNTLKGYDHTHLVTNTSYEEGMSSSMKFGLKTAQRIIENLDGVIFMLCDQPYIHATLLVELIDKHTQTNLPIVSCRYDNHHGPPTFMDKSLFTEIHLLQGDLGAKSLISKYQSQIAWISFTQGEIDVDSPDDIDRLKSII